MAPKIAPTRPGEDEAHRRLVALHPEMDALQARWEATPPKPKVMSALWSDDRLCAPYQVSHAAWSAAGYAIDHVTAAYALTVQQDGPTHYNIHTRPYAVYPMLRASFENACRCLWLVGAEDRATRVERRLRMVLTDAAMADEAVKLMADARPKLNQPAKLPEQRDRLRPLIQAAGLSMGRVKQSVRPSEVVRDGSGILPVEPNMGELLWRALSALSHGDFWAVRSLLDHDEISVTPDGQTVTMLTSSNAETVATFMAIVMNTAKSAVLLYDTQCTKRFQL